jgi:hypothetical protein
MTPEQTRELNERMIVRTLEIEARRRAFRELMEPKACRWGGCNGTGLQGGVCNRCGTRITIETEG